MLAGPGPRDIELIKQAELHFLTSQSLLIGSLGRGPFGATEYKDGLAKYGYTYFEAAENRRWLLIAASGMIAPQNKGARAEMHEELERAFSLEGRSAVVTGAGSGIGRETARTFAQAGAGLVIADVDAAGLEATADAVRALGAEVVVQRTDVAVRGEVDALAEAAVTRLGRLDVWANCAGILTNSPVLEETEERLDRLLAVNLKGTYWGCAAAGRAMQARGAGSIVNISSGGADSAAPTNGSYALTKAAVNMLTRTCAKEFGAFGVRVNAIAPGWIETGMTAYRFKNAAGAFDNATRDAALEMLSKASPLGLTGVPRDIALAMLYLASDASRFVTGQVLRPNGGVAMP
jgi:3-oxoacyl-[acyl-carrier protein] reductase